MNPSIVKLFIESKYKDPKKTALKFKRKDHWLSLSREEYVSAVENLALSLIRLGLKPKDPVILLSNTRMEWVISDMAILMAQGVTVPVYQNSRTEDLSYILNDCQAKILILEDKTQLAKWNEIKTSCPSIQTVILIEAEETLEDENLHSWMSLKNQGASQSQDIKSELQTRIENIRTEDFATLLYTSGTTGLPKGVVLTHTQILSEVTEVFRLAAINHKDLTLSFLPYAHILGRIEHWGSIANGYTLAFAESIERIRTNLQEVRPTFFIGVPRIFEKIYSGVLTHAQASPLKNRIFNWAIQVGEAVSSSRQNHEAMPLALILPYHLAKLAVYDNLKEQLGGRLRFAVSGGAPLSPEIAGFFHAAGVLILEGYGLTETTAAITVNTPFAYELGTVGKPIGDVELRFAEDGEILVKSDKVMKEYYKNPEATREAFDGEFFRTGDIGALTPTGFLKITDRKKDLIKTAGGKYVAPQRLEGLLKLSPLISNVLIHGDQKKYIVALVTLNEEILSQSGRGPDSYKEEVRKIISETNLQLASHESIKNFAILEKDFTIEEGELTPSLKVKRKFCDQKYKSIIDSLYES